MNGGNLRAERAVYEGRWASENIGSGTGGVQEMNEMAATKKNNIPTDEAYSVSAADVADKIIDLMQRGLDPLLLRTFKWALVPTSEC
jgi:hypothetical protein